MEYFKVSLGSRTPRKEPIPTTPHTPTVFSGRNNQEGLNVFDTYMWYTLWNSGCTHYINSYFDICTDYNPLDKWGNTGVNGIGVLVKPKWIGTIALYLEDKTSKIHNVIIKNVY